MKRLDRMKDFLEPVLPCVRFPQWFYTELFYRNLWQHLEIINDFSCVSMFTSYTIFCVCSCFFWVPNSLFLHSCDFKVIWTSPLLWPIIVPWVSWLNVCETLSKKNFKYKVVRYKKQWINLHSKPTGSVLF